MNYYFDVLKKYAVFGGRATRKEYWMFFLWNLIVYVILAIILGLTSHWIMSGILVDLIFVYALAMIIPHLSVGARRLHDTNHSAWWLLISLIPFIGTIIFLVFMVRDSVPGDNKYGPNPKGITVSQ